VRDRSQTVLLLTVLLAAAPVAAANDWWREIHCAGGASTHSEGELPEVENTLEEHQCHGTLGQQGRCASGDGSYSVTCGTVPTINGEADMCVASIDCGGSTFTCGGVDFEAFAGETTGIDARPRIFMVCRRGSTEEYRYCPDVT